MKYIFKIFAIIAIAMIQTSCIKNALNVEIPVIPSKLVVTSFISPDDTILLVLVTRSIPLNEYPDKKKMDELKSATVVMSNGNRKVVMTPVDLNTNQFFNFYYVDPYTVFFRASPDTFPIIPGSTYQLSVTDADGITVSAFTTVPLQKNTSEIARFYYSSDSTSNNSYKFDLECTDIPGETNYYRMDLSTAGSVRCSGYVDYSDQSNMVSDLGNDGKVLRIRNANLSSTCPLVGDSVTLLLANVDENYYKYQLSLYNYSGDNPFSEPTALYSNVLGGLGTFGSFNLFKKNVSFVLQ